MFSKKIHSFILLQLHDLDPVFRDNFGQEVMLVDHKSVPELNDTFFSSSDSIIESHIMSKLIVEYGVNKVASISLCALINLLESSKIVHPVEFRSLFLQIIPS